MRKRNNQPNHQLNKKDKRAYEKLLHEEQKLNYLLSRQRKHLGEL